MTSPESGRNLGNLFRVLVFVAKHHNMSSEVETTNKKYDFFPKPAQEKSQCSLLGFIRVSPAPQIATEIVADLVNSAVEKYSLCDLWQRYLMK